MSALFIRRSERILLSSSEADAAPPLFFARTNFLFLLLSTVTACLYVKT